MAFEVDALEAHDQPQTRAVGPTARAAARPAARARGDVLRARVLAALSMAAAAACFMFLAWPLGAPEATQPGVTQPELARPNLMQPDPARPDSRIPPSEFVSGGADSLDSPALDPADESSYVTHISSYPPADGGDASQPTVRHSVVLAMYRTAAGDCQCVNWQVNEWRDERRLSDFDPAELLEIALGVNCAPSIEQLLIFAVAWDKDDPPTDEEAEALAACAADASLPLRLADDAWAQALVDGTCVPDDAIVVAHAFTADTR